MRGQIRGLNQASRNAEDGISLLQTADGALNEVNNILQRVRELSVEAANDTNVEADRTAIQEEVDQLLSEVDCIGGSTEFNTRKLFDGSLDDESAQEVIVSSDQGLENGTIRLNIDFIENDFATTQSAVGDTTVAGYDSLKETLQEQIVPQAVTTLLTTYAGAFGYLSDSSIGIGLNLYSDTSSSVLASAAVGPSYSIASDGTISYRFDYQLSINMAALSMDASGNLTEDSRTELEGTILHEMVHTFMYEAVTNGSIGTANGTGNSENAFPDWFMEGMAQTAVGGYANWNDWVNLGLGITESTSVAQISSIVKNSENILTNTDSSKSSYGTGYLACMYLGMLGSGKSLTAENVTATNLTSGLDKILKELAGGKSLDTVINEMSGGKYTSTTDFESQFGDSDSAQFIQYLTKAVGEGNGSLVTGSFEDTDLLSNTDAETLLFALNTENTTVSNIYPQDVNVLNGGGTQIEGEPPVEGYTEETETTGGADIDVSTLTVGSGSGYTFDGNTLTITADGTYSLTGQRSGIEIKITEGVTVSLKLDDLYLYPDDTGISIGEGANVTLDVEESNVIMSDTGCAIEVKEGANLTITGSGTLFAYAGSGSGAAAIGSAKGEDAGTITINGTSGGALIIHTTGDAGVDGIGAGKDGTSGDVIKECGIIIDSANGGNGVYGNIVLSGAINVGNNGITVDSAATLKITSGGSITGKNGAVADVYNNGIIDNYGESGNVTNIGEGKVTHHVKSMSVNIEQPSELTVGDTLEEPGSAEIVVKYNGSNKVTLQGEWKITDQDGNEITDLSSYLAAENGIYLYSATFTLPDELSFGGGMSIYYNSTTNQYELLQGNSLDLIQKDSVKSLGTLVSSDNKSVTISYQVTPLQSQSGETGGENQSEESGLKLQVGANQGQSITLDFGEISTEKLGITGLSVMSHEDAGNAIKQCDGAIQYVSGARSRIGAYQNRLEFAIENMENTAENLEAAESRIRDLDMADAMVAYAKNQILIQAGQSILVQANKNTQGILMLLE